MHVLILLMDGACVIIGGVAASMDQDGQFCKARLAICLTVCKRVSVIAGCKFRNMVCPDIYYVSVRLSASLDQVHQCSKSTGRSYACQHPIACHLTRLFILACHGAHWALRQ